MLLAMFGLLPTLGCGGNIIFGCSEAPLVVALCAPTLFVALLYLRAGARADAAEAPRLAELPFRRFPEVL
ncbi:MAG TPA: hypothetical protein VMF86_12000, partial [Stellaceae bacterium]|nr:hypothetical protein [Stellaceae bacterium]